MQGLNRRNLHSRSFPRGSIFSAAQMENHARCLGRPHDMAPDKEASRRLLARLDDSEMHIRDAYALIAGIVEGKQQAIPLGEWLADNFYLIEEKIRNVRKSMPQKKGRPSLPCLQRGKKAGLPRIYELAAEFVLHTDASIDKESLGRFISIYQETAPLQLAELWALPTMLELAIIESLGRIAHQLSRNCRNRDLASHWASRMLETAGEDPSALILVIADMARAQPDLEGPFVAELVRCLQGQGSSVTLPLNWIEQRLSQSADSIERLVQREVQLQAADQVSMSNGIGSLRFISHMNWQDFIETASVVEGVLRDDPAGIYTHMDFETRDRYRHVIEHVAQESLLPEKEIAQKALDRASKSFGKSKEAHIGYYLVGKGLTLLEQDANAHLPRSKKWSLNQVYPLSLYLLVFTLLTVVPSLGLSAWLIKAGVATAPVIILSPFLLMSFSYLAAEIINSLVSRIVKPRFLPSMDFAAGIPDEARTLVTVPTMISNRSSVDQACKALEVRFLANRSRNLYFCLLTDFPDAWTEHLVDDDSLLAYAGEKIQALNVAYPENEDSFFLLHRPRLWNSQENKWMGYERKRGKLAALNSFLLEGDTTAFSFTAGRLAVLKNIRYVITLDADTGLPLKTAQKMAAAMAHPLNHPHYDERAGRITEGYGILQPRMATGFLGSTVSLYARLFGGEGGIDPYTRAVSDAYQDLFAQGSFVGKGIYDVAAFEVTLKNRLPENRILSHDLLEGCYTRSGLLNTVQLYEDYPSSYAADIKRRHRWVRGDWQIARWLFSVVPGLTGRMSNPCCPLGRWKIFDNLRRSLVPLAFLITLVAGWLWLPKPWLWTSVAAVIFFLPLLCTALIQTAHKSEESSFSAHICTVWTDAIIRALRILTDLSFLPYEAKVWLDAIGRASWRMLVSRRRLLEWVPFSEAGNSTYKNMLVAYVGMWISPLLAVVLFLLLNHVRPLALSAAEPFLTLWILAPAIAYGLSRPLMQKKTELSAQDSQLLNLTARQMWGFFEIYAGPEDHWLPPDNVQEQPRAAVAHRTSPTNMGLSLLANLSAWDFGYVTPGRVMERTGQALSTMEALPRYRGHFFNWYNTSTLTVLYPLYISSVDSGNLAGHLIALRQGLLSLAQAPIIPAHWQEGLRITAELIESPISVLKEKLSAPVVSSPSGIFGFVEECLSIVGKEEPTLWTEAFLRQCRDMKEELGSLAPWVATNIPADILEKCGLNAVPSLCDLSAYDVKCIEEPELRELVQAAVHTAQQRLSRIDILARQAQEMSVMDFTSLMDPASGLLSIGYNVENQKLDASTYDLLASEARLTYFVAIAQGQLPQESWFKLGRRLTPTKGVPTLFSWSGSIFEYLMPLLVMPDYPGTLLAQTCDAAVQSQINYGVEKNVPWGISESGYYMFDNHLNYQYRAFGVPELGLKRGLGDDLVIAPYATLMALMVSPMEACRNLQRLASEGFRGRFGFYEAIDYTPARLPRHKNHEIIRSFMAHHHGMGFLSLSHVLHDAPMQQRFANDPLFQAAATLLYEAKPKIVATQGRAQFVPTLQARAMVPRAAPVRIINNPDTPTPEVQLLSNGRYHVMITAAGGGYSRWHGLSLTRWREDVTRDNYGMFFYVRDKATGVYWSAARQPAEKQPEHYQAIFSESRAEFRRRDGDIELHAEIVVCPEADVEIRRLRLTNRGRRRKDLDITSYTEAVLAPAAADLAHPAFSNLFVQTEALKNKNTILCTRRSRAMEEKPPYLFHTMQVYGAEEAAYSFETSRPHFIGPGLSAAAPKALREAGALGGHEGSVLDPILSLRRDITLAPGQSAVVDVVTGAAATREDCLKMAEKYREQPIADRVFDLAWMHGQALLRQLNISEDEAQIYSRLAGTIIYASKQARAAVEILARNRLKQKDLWRFGISGDLPLVLLKIKEGAHMSLARQMLHAHAWWKMKGLPADLVIWNEDKSGYRQDLQNEIMGLISSGTDPQSLDRSGGIFVRSADQLSADEKTLLESVASLIIDGAQGALDTQAALVRHQTAPSVPALAPVSRFSPYSDIKIDLPSDLLFFNGTGGFSSDGREYIIKTGAGNATPLPWSNIIANPDFGTVISESGPSYTWGENAHEFRLTPWHNDPVTRSSGEVFYVRDEESGIFWSPTPLPVASKASYVVRHGFGYSIFESAQNGVHSSLTIYVAINVAVKFTTLKLRNDTARDRHLSVTGYVEWVLGEVRAKTGLHIVTETDTRTGALLARNSYNSDFASRIAFFDCDEEEVTITGDRSEFIGRNKDLGNPEVMRRQHLSGRTGAGLDSCGALQTVFTLAPGEEREIVFRLGVVNTVQEDVSSFIRTWRGIAAAQTALQKVHGHWQEALGRIQVETPDKSIDVLVNGWLVYQTMACRLWARSGYYQSGGAYGFRDQLQDAMGLAALRPDLLREQILLHASRQFVEGDVMHWWHPPAGRGVRTRCSDDYLWLPLAVCHYVSVTGDESLLDQKRPFIEGRLLNEHEEAYYDLPTQSGQEATIYEHCVRAISHGLSFGAHGLPLIGSCDWNDGMDRVGIKGKGESVWLGFFLYMILQRFAHLADLRQDPVFSAKCRNEAAKLQNNIEEHAWDGGWYRRAYFDDGQPLGSATNEECQIDSLAQSWAVLSGAGDETRTRLALEAAYDRLVKENVVQLLDPPFDKSALNPGYIRGYIPGVRENGGQYTHAAIWLAMAFAARGDFSRAWEIANIINPINHGRTAKDIEIYKAEPYVVAADVYMGKPHEGRGGWTWYTGSAGWMYRLFTEDLLGLHVHGDALKLNPCLPADWKGCKITYKYRNTNYVIEIGFSHQEQLILDGVVQAKTILTLADDGRTHHVSYQLVAKR
jgi:cyclic beta-1,2-glucan synthetase